MIFYALTLLGGVERRGFQVRGQQMLMYQKSMFDRYYCIKHFFSLKNFGEIASKKSFYLYLSW